jgi:hypothetical protein
MVATTNLQLFGVSFWLYFVLFYLFSEKEKQDINTQVLGIAVSILYYINDGLFLPFLYCLFCLILSSRHVCPANFNMFLQDPYVITKNPYGDWVILTLKRERSLE